MDKAQNLGVETGPALVMANPGTREERIFLIRNSYMTESGAWFHSHENLTRGTYTKIIFQLKYDLDQRTIRIERYGRVVKTGFMGFEVEFDV